MSMFYNIHHLNIDFPPDIKQKHFNCATKAQVPIIVLSACPSYIGSLLPQVFILY